MTNLTAESALAAARQMLLCAWGHLNKTALDSLSKTIARNKIQTAIDTLRACAKERCLLCGNEIPTIEHDLGFWHVDQTLTGSNRWSCAAQFEHRHIARLVKELGGIDAT